jgi:hypothetical protein
MQRKTMNAIIVAVIMIAISTPANAATMTHADYASWSAAACSEAARPVLERAGASPCTSRKPPTGSA